MTSPIRRNVTDLLDGGYDKAAKQMLRAIGAELQGGIIKQRLDELVAEAERLDAEGQRLRPDNPVMRALLADMDSALDRNKQRMADATPQLTEAGVDASFDISRTLTFSGGGSQLAQLQAQFNRPDPQAVAALVDFTNDPAWNQLLNSYKSDIIERLRLRATFGFVSGWGARRSARALRLLAVGMPAHEAENITRTLHLVSYRRGTAATHVTNAHLLQPTAIRIAVLDPRTCLSCVALHGTKVPLGKPIADHWRGRCTSIAQVRGFNRNIQSGTDWFNSLSETRQQQQRSFQQSPGAYDAFKAGAVTLNDFVHEFTDDLFGEMIQQASLKKILGADAQNYYRRGRTE